MTFKVSNQSWLCKFTEIWAWSFIPKISEDEIEIRASIHKFEENKDYLLKVEGLHVCLTGLLRCQVACVNRPTCEPQTNLPGKDFTWGKWRLPGIWKWFTF